MDLLYVYSFIIVIIFVKLILQSIQISRHGFYRNHSKKSITSISSTSSSPIFNLQHMYSGTNEIASGVHISSLCVTKDGHMIFSGDGISGEKLQGAVYLHYCSSEKSGCEVNHIFTGVEKAERLGSSMDISTNGQVIALGAPGKNLVRVYRKKIRGDFCWYQCAILKHPIQPQHLKSEKHQGEGEEEFGFHVKVNADGSLIAVSSPDSVTVEMYQVSPTSGGKFIHVNTIDFSPHSIFCFVFKSLTDIEVGFVGTKCIDPPFIGRPPLVENLGESLEYDSFGSSVAHNDDWIIVSASDEEMIFVFDSRKQLKQIIEHVQVDFLFFISQNIFIGGSKYHNKIYQYTCS